MKATAILIILTICGSLTAHAQEHGEKGTGVIGSRTVDYSLGDKADGWYVLGMVPVIKKKLQVKARYQTYRESKEWGSSKNLFEVGANYFFSKNMQLNFEYARVNDRTIDRKDYNILDVQLNFRF